MKKKMRFLNLLAVLIVLFAGVHQADAANLAGRSQVISQTNGYPTWYQDDNNLALTPCLDENGFCLPLGTTQPLPTNRADINSSNFPPEAFYFLAEVEGASSPNGTISGVLYVAALEAGFAAAVVDRGQAVFTRIRIRANVTLPGTYVVTHPYGTDTFVVATPGNRVIDFSEDIPGLVANQFDAPLTSRVGPFLTKADGTFVTDTVTGNRYLANPGVPTAVTGGPNGNILTITAPNGDNLIVNTFILSGKVIGLDVTPGTALNLGAATIAAAPISTPPQTQTVTVTNTSANPIFFEAITTAGANAADFNVVAPDTCSNTPVAAEASCSFNVNFAPTATTPVLALRAATILLNPTTVNLPPPAVQLPNPPAVTLSLSGTAQFPLVVTVNGTPLDNPGAGSVISVPAGINCTTAGGVNCTASFNAGSTVTLTPSASASPLSLFDGWISDGTPNAINNNIIVTMDAAKAATASFIRAFNITTSTDVNGTITAGSIVKQGTSPTLVITPNTGFHFLSLLDNNVSVTAAVVPPTPPAVSSSFTINDNNLGISTDHAVAAAFAVNNYPLTLTATTNGTITGPASADHSTTAIFTITPALGHHIATLTDSGDATANPQSVQAGLLGTSTYTTTAITGPRTITVTFLIGQENITTSVSKGNGTIVADAAAVNFGSNSTITITPALGYHIETLTDNGTDVKASVTPGSAGTFTYTINGVVVEHNVVVGLSNVLNLTSSAGANGTLASPSTAIFGTTPSITATPKSRLFQVRDILKNNSALPFTKAANPGDAVTIALPAVTADSTVNATFMPSGDLNADGSLTVADAMKALRIVIGLQVASGDDAVAMDVAPLGSDNKPLGGNGSDMADVLVILKRVVNAITW